MVVQDLKTGLSPLDALYLQNPACPYSTILFAGIEESDPSITDPLFAGFFTIGAPVQLAQIFADVGGLNTSAFPPLESIGQQPPVPLNPSDYTFNLDLITVTSDPGGSVLNQTAILDTRSNVSFAPANIVSIVLGTATSVSIDFATGLFTIPCDTEVTMSMEIAGVTIPIDPATIAVQIPGRVDACLSGVCNIEFTVVRRMLTESV